MCEGVRQAHRCRSMALRIRGWPGGERGGIAARISLYASREEVSDADDERDRGVQEEIELDEHTGPDFDVRRAYAEHGGVLLGFVVNAVGDRGLAEDCVQETFVRAWRARDSFRPQLGSERTWLFAIGRNVVIDALRARARRPQVVPADGLPEPVEPAPGRRQVEDRMTLLAALARLGPEQRQVVAAVHLDGATYAEVSAATGVPVATLRTRMFYGLKTLRKIMREEDHDGT